MKVSRIVLLGLLLLAIVLAGAQDLRVAEAQSRCPGGSVSVTPANVGTVFAVNPAGTIYCFADGTYSNFSLFPEDNDKFYSSSLHGAVLDGNGVTRSAFAGVADTGDVLANAVNVTVDGFKIIGYSNPGIWTSTPNDAALSIYSGWVVNQNLCEGNSAPPGTVPLGNTTKAMTGCITIAKGNWGCAVDVTISGNIMRGMTHLAILGNMIDGDIVNNVIQNNGWGARSRIDANGNTTQQDSQDVNNIEWNGIFKITNMNVAYTGWASGRYDCNTTGRTAYVGSNIIEANRWVCIWADINVVTMLVENNTCTGNSGAAVMHEISGAGVYRFNTFRCNNYEWNAQGWASGELTVWDSKNLRFENNVVRGCGPGDSYTAGGVTRAYNPRDNAGAKVIAIINANRGNSDNLTFSNNDFSISAASSRAVLIERYSNSVPINTTFTGNTYRVTQLGRQIYQDTASNTNFAGWQGKGKDTGGTETTNQGQSAIATATPGGPTATTAPTATASPTAPASGPYLGTARSIPGTIQAEDFDYGDASVFDTDPANFFGFVYRPTSVDIKTINPAPGVSGFAIGYAFAGEWTKYTVNVTTTGYYDLSVLLLTTEQGSRSIQMYLDGSTLGAPFVAPRVLDWDSAPVEVKQQNIYMAAGTRTLEMRVVQGFLDVDSFTFSLASGVTSTPTNTPTLTPTASNTPVPTPSTGRIQAESFAAQSGSAITFNGDDGGAATFLGITTNWWTRYDNVALAQGIASARIRVQAEPGVGQTATIELRTGSQTGTAFCTFTVPNTAVYITVTGTCTPSAATGTQNIWLYVVSAVGGSNINWFELDANIATATATFTPTSTATITPSPVPSNTPTATSPPTATLAGNAQQIAPTQTLQAGAVFSAQATLSSVQATQAALNGIEPAAQRALLDALGTQSALDILAQNNP